MVYLTLILYTEVLDFPKLSPADMILQLGTALCSCYNGTPEQ